MWSFSPDAKRTGRDANYTFPEVKLGLEVLYYLRKVTGRGVNHWLLFRINPYELQRLSLW
jgi:hypothetical protein